MLVHNDADKCIATYLQRPVKRMVTVNFKRDLTLLGLQQFYEDEFLKRICSHKKNTYFLSMPYVMFKIPYRKNDDKNFYYAHQTPFVLFATSDDLSKKKYYVPIFNVNSQAQVCLGASFWSPGLRPEYINTNLQSLCENVVKSFWSSEFNNEYSDSLIYYHKVSKK